MLFNSLEFLLFLPIVFALYWILGKRTRLQNALVVVASYVFYGWWDWRFLLLIAFTTVCSFASGVLLEKNEGNRLRQKWISAGNITINLLILGFFKYCNFFGESFADLLGLFGLKADWTTLNIILPVGISFYTFQALSYTIDVYRKKLEPTHDPVAFFAFISFFPQLVAGPIERATNLLPQFQRKRRFTYEQGADGMRQMLWGFFKKIVVADNCALVVDSVWGGFEGLKSTTLILAAVLFSIQIYCDFSGYSDIAIGCAKLFGIKLMRNFNAPYFSRNIAEFWRRWHISLTTWFRDYIYIPLGGSRVGKWKVVRNTFIIYLVSGFWHGANWTFIAWGAYHALLFLPLILLGRNRKFTNQVGEGRWLPSLKEVGQMACTFVLAVVGWILFRANTIGEAWRFFCGIFTQWNLQGGSNTDPVLFVWIGLLFVVEWIFRDKEHAFDLEKCHWMVRWGAYLVLTFIILIFGAFGETNFIYFQF